MTFYLDKLNVAGIMKFLIFFFLSYFYSHNNVFSKRKKPAKANRSKDDSIITASFKESELGQRFTNAKH